MKLIIKLAIQVSSTFLICAYASAGDKPVRAEGEDGASTLVVGVNADARYILDTIPAEAALERFEMIDPKGRHIFYVALTDTDVGGLVFVDTKLLGTVSRHDAESFYSCRGYESTAQSHWAEDALDWANALIGATTPATSVKLQFSGKSSPRSIKEIANIPLFGQLSIFDITTNPISLLKKLNSAHGNMKERDKYEKTSQDLRSVVLGAKEVKVAEVLTPEDVFFGDDGLVLAYPRYGIEFYVSGGSVKIAQEPSFYRIAHVRPAMFYAPNTKWDECTPQNWRNALPALKAVAAPDSGAAPK